MILWHFLHQRLKGIPWGLLGIIYLLIILGLINLYSATGAYAQPARFYDQLQWIILGTMAAIFWGIIMDARAIERFTIFGYIVVCALS